MAQIFHRSSNVISKASIIGLVVLANLAIGTLVAWQRSDFATDVGVAPKQPVPFSHQHHVTGLGIDCRYCHTSVETSAYAGIPPTATCMNCHKAIWTNAQLLEPIRASYRDNKPVAWARVNNVAGFVQFNHSIHIKKGVGCVSCHGRIDRMQLTSKGEPLHMAFCLNCHRNPEKYVRPASEIYNFEYQRKDPDEGVRLVTENHIRKVTNCSACHY
jgi:hypothetical protein